MEEKRQEIIKHIKERLSTLNELGKTYSDDKISNLADNLLKTNKPLSEIFILIDNKFANQTRKVNHNNYLASLREYYIANIDKLKKGNNCYLLSYDQGVKILEQAYLEDKKKLSEYQTLVNVNNLATGYKKENSINNDYELIMSDIAYLLKLPYAKTYRIFDGNMNPQGIVNIAFDKHNERFLNMEEALRFVKEESIKFTLTQELINYHDKRVRFGLKTAKTNDEIKETIDYVLKLFSALPDITEDNINKLKYAYLNMKVFELLSNSLNNNLSNFGIIINKENQKYTYELSPSYNKYTVDLPTIDESKTICNFLIVNKHNLLEVLIKNYYHDIKELLSLIVNNKATLLPIIKQVIKEHIEYDAYNKYIALVTGNLDMIESQVTEKKAVTIDTPEDTSINEDNNILYRNRIAPFIDNYVTDEYEETSKGSTILLAIVTFILLATIAIIALAVYSISKMNM